MIPFRQCPDTTLLRFWLETDLTFEQMHLSLLTYGYRQTVPQLKYRMRRTLKRHGLVPHNATARHYRTSRRNPTRQTARIDPEALV